MEFHSASARLAALFNKELEAEGKGNLGLIFYQEDSFKFRI